MRAHGDMIEAAPPGTILILAVVALVRNEADIIHLFLDALGRLFDHAVIVDQCSTDGTREAVADACASRPGWAIWKLETAGYHHSQVSTVALRQLMDRSDAEHVAFLDADEFIDTPARSAFAKSLATLAAPEHVWLLR